MPRKAPERVVEHRISFSDKERSQIEQIIKTAQTNVAVDGVTSTLNALGGALAGGGLFWASLGLVVWFGGGKILDATKSTINKTWDIINESIADPISDAIVDATLEDAPVFDTAYWTEINRQDKERLEQAQANFNMYAIPGSQHYDKSKALIAYEELQNAVKIQKTNDELEIEARRKHNEWFSLRGYDVPIHYSLLVAKYNEDYRVWVENGRQGDPPIYPAGDGSPQS